MINEIMIVGDSLTSDMEGGNRAGIQCCWYNPGELLNTTGVYLDAEIRNLDEIRVLLKTGGDICCR